MRNLFVALCLGLVCVVGRAQGMVTVLAFSGDGQTVAAGDDTGSVSWWSGGKLRSTAALHQDYVHGVVFRGGQWVSWARDDSVVISSAKGKLLSRFLAPPGCEISDGQLSPNGLQLATAGDGPVLLWDLRSGKTTRLDTRVRGVRTRLDYSPDGAWMAVGVSNSVIVYDTKTGRRVAKLDLDNNDFQDLAFEGPTKLWTLDELSLRGWDSAGWKRTSLRLIPGGAEGRALRLSPSGSGKLLLEALDGIKLQAEVNVVGDLWVTIPDRALGFAGEDQVLVLPSYTKGTSLLTAKDGKVFRKLPHIQSKDGHMSIPPTVAISPDGSKVAVVENYRKVKIHSLR